MKRPVCFGLLALLVNLLLCAESGQLLKENSELDFSSLEPPLELSLDSELGLEGVKTNLPPSVEEALQSYILNTKMELNNLELKNIYLTQQYNQQKILNQLNKEDHEKEIQRFQKVNKFYGIISITAILTSCLCCSLAVALN